jgi:serine/threonine protein kinase
VLLSGQSPFKFSQDHETQNAIIQCDFDFDDADWSNRSDKCKNLIRRCLQRRPEDRPTASDLLTDDWLVNSPIVPSKSVEFETSKSSISRKLSKRQSTTSILDEENSNISSSFDNDEFNPNKKGRFLLTKDNSLTMTTEETVL